MATTVNLVIFIAVIIVLNGLPISSNTSSNEIYYSNINDCSYLITASRKYTFSLAVEKCQSGISFLPALTIASANSGHLNKFVGIIYIGHQNNATYFWTGLRYDAASNRTFLGALEIRSPKIKWNFSQDTSIDCLVAISEESNVIALHEGDCSGQYHVACVGVSGDIEGQCAPGQTQVPNYDSSCKFSCEDNPTTVPSTQTQTATPTPTADHESTMIIASTESPGSNLTITETTGYASSGLSRAEVAGIAVGVVIVVLIIGIVAVWRWCLQPTHTPPNYKHTSVMNDDEQPVTTSSSAHMRLPEAYAVS